MLEEYQLLVKCQDVCQNGKEKKSGHMPTPCDKLLQVNNFIFIEQLPSSYEYSLNALFKTIQIMFFLPI